MKRPRHLYNFTGINVEQFERLPKKVTTELAEDDVLVTRYRIDKSRQVRFSLVQLDRFYLYGPLV